jgi:hypothetical protein
MPSITCLNCFVNQNAWWWRSRTGLRKRINSPGEFLLGHVQIIRHTLKKAAVGSKVRRRRRLNQPEGKEVGPDNRANHLRPYRDPHCDRCQNHCDHCDCPWKDYLTKQKVIGADSAEILLIHDIISDVGYNVTRYRIVQSISVYQNSVTDIGTKKRALPDIGIFVHDIRRYRRIHADIGFDMTPISANIGVYPFLATTDIVSFFTDIGEKDDIGPDITQISANIGVPPVSCHH